MFKRTIEKILLAGLLFTAALSSIAIGQEPPTQSALAQMANTKLSVYVTLPPAQKIAIYDKVSRVFVQVQGKADPSSMVPLENYLVFNEQNKGKPYGYEIFLQYAADIVAGKLAYKGVTGDTAGVFGSIRVIGLDYLQQRQNQQTPPAK